MLPLHREGCIRILTGSCRMPHEYDLLHRFGPHGIACHLPGTVPILSLIDQIETEAATRRAKTGGEPLGVAAILGQHPHHRPRHLKKSPAPLFHAISQTVRRELYEGYAWFVAAFRQAAEKLKAGDRSAAFPIGSFPPALPFVGG